MTDGLQIDGVVGLRNSFFQATVKRCSQRGLVPFDPAEHACFETFLSADTHISHTSEKMSAKCIMINPPKMLYICLYCIQWNLYFGIITYFVNPLVDLKSASRICEASGISDVICDALRISKVRDA
jgi:hypothetical protein